MSFPNVVGSPNGTRIHWEAQWFFDTLTLMTDKAERAAKARHQAAETAMNAAEAGEGPASAGVAEDADRAAAGARRAAHVEKAAHADEDGAAQADRAGQADEHAMRAARGKKAGKPRTAPAEEPLALARIHSLPSWLLNRAAPRGRRRMSDALARDGMRRQHHSVLSAVADLGPVTQAELGRATGFDPKDMVGILNDLQAQDLVVRVPDPKDRRKNSVTLTASGRDRLVRLAELGDEANEALLALLTPAERQLFLGLLARVAEADAARDVPHRRE